MQLSKIFFGFLVVILLAFNACTKKTAFTNAEMKPWFDQNCKSCHGSGGEAQNRWAYDAKDYENSIKANIAVLKQVVLVKKSMPPAPVVLNQSELDKFNSWVQNGFPAN
jgi:mono/diheme cytochrome c family protein